MTNFTTQKREKAMTLFSGKYYNGAFNKTW